jgi:hypothetical protein
LFKNCVGARRAVPDGLISIESMYFKIMEISWAYFVAICVQNKLCLFGEVSDGVVRLNEFGQIARNEWFEIEKHRPNVELDAFVVMQNHMHGIVFLKNADDVGECSTKTRRARHAVPLRIPSTNPIILIVCCFVEASFIAPLFCL